jgi:hypothetical protein
MNRKPPAAGRGRKKGELNKATKNAREAIARLVDDNAGRMQAWLDQIAEKDGPMAAWKCMSDVIEYHIPKLSRTELTGKDGEKLPPAVFNIQPVKPSE